MRASRNRRHDPNEGARYIVTARRAPSLALAPDVSERGRLPEAKRLALDLLDLDLDGDCYVEVEVECVRASHRAVVYRHARGESELKLRRALLRLRKATT